MKMLIAHSGRTGKETSVTFDTDRKIFVRGREDFDVFLYAEQTHDVNGVIDDLLKIDFREVSREEFVGTKVTTREEMRLLREGDVFYVGGAQHTANGDAHPSGDASYDGYVVYDESGEGWFEEDFPAVA